MRPFTSSANMGSPTQIIPHPLLRTLSLGLASLVTGGSPTTTGLWYDVTYNRALSPPLKTDSLGNPAGPCPGQIGTIVAWDESTDKDLTKLNTEYDPDFAVRDPQNGCKPLKAHEYLRVDTIFEVVEGEWRHNSLDR